MAIAENIQAWCEAPESLSLLRLKPDEASLTWSDGGCSVLAMAVRDVYPDAKVWAVFGDAQGETDTIWHMFVELSGVMFDAERVFEEPGPKEAAQAWAAHHNTIFRSCKEIDCDHWMPRDSAFYLQQIRPVGNAFRKLLTHDLRRPLSAARPESLFPEIGM